MKFFYILVRIAVSTLVVIAQYISLRCCYIFPLKNLPESESKTSIRLFDIIIHHYI